MKNKLFSASKPIEYLNNLKCLLSKNAMFKQCAMVFLTLTQLFCNSGNWNIVMLCNKCITKASYIVYLYNIVMQT